MSNEDFFQAYTNRLFYLIISSAMCVAGFIMLNSSPTKKVALALGIGNVALTYWHFQRLQVAGFQAVPFPLYQSAVFAVLYIYHFLTSGKVEVKIE